MTYLRNIKGFTLIELIISMVIFLFVIGLMYPTFNLIRGQSVFIENMEALNERAQRLVDYMAEDIRMAGFVVGPKENIPYCTDNASTGVPVVRLTQDANPYDSLAFITTEPVTIRLTEACQNNNPGYWLNTTADASVGAGILTTENVTADCILNLKAGAVGSNGSALIALETASYVNNIYTVTQINTGSLQITPSLQITVPSNSMIYTVRQYEYLVDPNTRELERRFWQNDCGSQAIVLDEATGQAGGVDALQFEFLVYDAATDSIVVQSTPPDDLLSIRGIRIWVLLRSDSPDRDHTDTNTYNVGTMQNGNPITGVTVGPFNDNFHRVLVNRTVEVKNFGG